MNKELTINTRPLGGKRPRFRAMPMIRKLVYGTADGMLNFL